MKIVNLTSHVLRLNDGTEYMPSGTVARVESVHVYRNDICYIHFGDVINVPPPEDGTLYVASALVSSRLPDREDVVSPDTNNPATVRHDGQVYSVPGFMKVMDGYKTGWIKGYNQAEHDDSTKESNNKA